jgi:hypothetical protein
MATSLDYSLCNNKAPGATARLISSFKLTELQAAAPEGIHRELLPFQFGKSGSVSNWSLAHEMLLQGRMFSRPKL